MFGFGRKKEAPKSSRTRERDDGFKIPQIDFNFDGMDDDDGGIDEDLEDELRLILEGGEIPTRPIKVKSAPVGGAPKRPPPPPTSRSAAAKQIHTDDEDDDSDPDLLNELDKILDLDLGDKPSPNKKPNSSINISQPQHDAFSPTETDDDTNLILVKLMERRERYELEVKKSGDNIGKARRMGRIVSQYEDALAKIKLGQIVNFEELPTPPGFEPIIVPAVPSSTSIQVSKSTEEIIISPPAPLGQPVSLFIPTEEPKIDDFFEDVAPQVPPRPRPRLPKPISPVRDIIQNQQTEVKEPTKVIEPIKVEQLPPPIPIKIPSKSKVPEPIELSFEQKQLAALIERQAEFKKAALSAKKLGNIDQTKKLLKYSLGFNTFIEQSRAGQTIDFDTIPVPSEVIANLEKESQEPPQTQKVDLLSSEELNQNVPMSLPPEVVEQEQPVVLDNKDQILTKLEQRLARYQEEVVKAGDNQRKSRQMGRIVKQYQDAISQHKRGKPVPYDELPVPPGFDPIIVSVQPSTGIVSDPTPIEPSIPSGPGPSASSPSASKTGSIIRGAPGKPQTKLTLQEKQLALLLERQNQFKQAAITAKKRGDLEQAKQLLKSALGFNKLIEYSKSGLPVDLATLPSPPELVASLEKEADTFEVVSADDCIGLTGDSAEIYSKLEEDLRAQMTMCMQTREHFRNIGDVGSANRFEKMAIESKKDLDALRIAMKKGNDIPKFHYETRVFSITECNTDLKDDEIEISVLRGINFKVPNPDDIDTFVKVDLAYPSAEEVQSNKSNVVKDTNNPEYNVTYKMAINRGARNFQRFIHRHAVKVEVWSKGGFLRGSTLVGTGSIKLLTLETKCSVHEAIDILDGRKVIGKLEVKVRLRDPVLTKEIKQRKEKWLTLDRI